MTTFSDSELYAQVGDSIRQARLIQCTREQYPAYRHALHRFAGDNINNRQAIYAQIALEEVRRLDKLFDYSVVPDCHQ